MIASSLALFIIMGFAACAGKHAARDPKRFIREHSLDRLPHFDIPIEMNDRVVAWMEYFQGPGRNHFRRYLERSGRYLPLMQEILKRDGMPKDLVYIALIESGFNTQARSYANAVGPWQFIQGTGRRYNLRIDGWVDERRDPFKSTHAAAQYFKDLYSEFGDWYLAMAGYNAGEGRVRKAIETTGSRNFWEMSDDRRAFRAETRDYVPKYIAAAIMAKMPERFGFDNVDYREPFDFDTSIVETQTDLSVIAKCAATSEDDILDLNPHLTRGATPVGSSNYGIRIPKGKAKAFAEQYAALPKEERIQIVRHEIRKGDTLQKIAKRYGVSARAIASANDLRLSRHHLKRGNSLIIPVGSQAARYASIADVDGNDEGSQSSKKQVKYTVKKGESLGAIAGRYGVTTKQIMLWNRIKDSKRVRAGMKLVIKTSKGRASGSDEKTAAASPAAATRSHKVQRGETLATIARRYGVTPKELMAMNGINNPKALKAGTNIVVSMAKVSAPSEDSAAGAPVRLAGKEISASPEAPKYKVQRGDTISAIAQRHNIPLKDLMAMNNIKNPKSVREGTQLVIGARKPDAGAETKKESPGAPLQSLPTSSAKEILESREPLVKSLSDDAGMPISSAAPSSDEARSQTGTPIKLANVELPKLNEAKEALPKGALTYQVKDGDTLWDIARRHKVSIAEIQKWNNLADPSAVKPGTTLTIHR